MATGYKRIGAGAVGIFVVLTPFLGGCGGDSRVSLEEYVEEMRESTDELQVMGEK